MKKRRLALFLCIVFLFPTFTAAHAKAPEKAQKSSSAQIIFAGDLMALGGQINTARTKMGYDFKPAFAKVRSIIRSADYAIGNLETPVAGKKYGYTKTGQKGTPVLNAPKAYLDAVKWAGFGCVVTANNHCLDKGEAGLKNTLAALDKKKLLHTGTFRTKKEKQKNTIIDVNSIRVGVLSYSTIFNGKQGKLSKAKRSYMINPYSAAKAKKEIRALKKKADVVVVYMHWGVENTNFHNKTQEKMAKELAKSGADLIIGSHPHMLQKISSISVKIDGKTKKVPVAYSLGNFVSSMPRPGNRDSVLYRVTFKKDASGAVSIQKQECLPVYTGSGNRLIGPSKIPAAAAKRIKKAVGKQVKYAKK